MSLRSSKNKKIEKRPAKSCEESIIAAYGGLFSCLKNEEEKSRITIQGVKITFHAMEIHNPLPDAIVSRVRNHLCHR